MKNYIKARNELVKMIDEIIYDFNHLSSFMHMINRIIRLETKKAGDDAIANACAAVIAKNELLAFTSPKLFLEKIREALIQLNDLKNWDIWTDDCEASSTEELIERAFGRDRSDV